VAVKSLVSSISEVESLSDVHSVPLKGSLSDVFCRTCEDEEEDCVLGNI
jgi:hypothetical protein